MKRILYLANLNPNKLGSMEEHALFLSREIRRRGDQCYLGFISEPGPEIRRLFEEAGAKVVTVYCGNTALVGNGSSLKLREMLALRRVVVENGIDLVHFNFMGVTNPELIGVYLTGAKIVFTEHASGGAPQRSPCKRFLSRCLHGVISRRISRYVAVSEFVLNRMKVTHHVSGAKSVLIYNGVNLERFSPRDRNEARQELGLPLDIPIVCSVAMLIPQKGLQHLIEAVSLLQHDRKLPGLLALIVGEGGYRSELEQLAKNLSVSEQVRFLGRRSDVQTIIAACDAVVVPSVWEEAFGLIVAEAIASGRPVVASRIGGIPEVVSDGETGFLVGAGCAEEIAGTLLGIITGQQHAARPHDFSKFSLDVTSKQLAALYAEVCGA
jgi:L-malate glycosyltransferase